MYTPLRHQLVKTHGKSKKCFACLRKFPKKTMMYSWAGVSVEYGLCSGYSCTTCDDLMGMIHLEDGYPDGWVLEELEKGQTPEDLLEQVKLRNIPKAAPTISFFPGTAA